MLMTLTHLPVIIISRDRCENMAPVARFLRPNFRDSRIRPKSAGQYLVTGFRSPENVTITWCVRWRRFRIITNPIHPYDNSSFAYSSCIICQPLSLCSRPRSKCSTISPQKNRYVQTRVTRFVYSLFALKDDFGSFGAFSPSNVQPLTFRRPFD